MHSCTRYLQHGSPPQGHRVVVSTRLRALPALSDVSVADHDNLRTTTVANCRVCELCLRRRRWQPGYMCPELLQKRPYTSKVPHPLILLPPPVLRVLLA